VVVLLLLLLLLLLLQEMKIENIDTTLEEIQEVGEQMRVINEAISQPVGGLQVRGTDHTGFCCGLPRGGGGCGLPPAGHTQHSQANPTAWDLRHRPHRLGAINNLSTSL
jgi:hypothetical protein